MVDGQVWWVFDTQSYENMAANMQDYLKAITQLQAVNDYYEECLKQ